MNVSVLQEKLLKHLSFVGKNVSAKSQLPITQCVLIEAKNNELYLTTTNLETTITSEVSAKIKEEGDICIPARLLMEFITSLPPGKVDMNTKDQSLHVKGNGFEATIPGLAASEFPKAPKGSGKKTSIELPIFLEAMRSVVYAAATDEGRPVLTGVRITKTEEGIELAATDGYRLSLRRSPLVFTEAVDSTIPARALADILRIGGEAKDEKTIDIELLSDKQLGFFIGGTGVYTRSIDGEYPNYAKIIPKTHTTKIVIKKEDFLRAVKSAAIFARDNANIVKIHAEENMITVSANTPQVGENTVDFPATTEGEGGDIAFNSRFLLEFLNNAHSENILLEITGSLNPGVFREEGDDAFLHIIMPVRVQGQN